MNELNVSALDAILKSIFSLSDGSIWGFFRVTFFLPVSMDAVENRKARNTVLLFVLEPKRIRIFRVWM